MMNKRASKKIEFGDFQTPLSLAKKSVDIVSQLIEPDFVLEPTCGLGYFLEASFQRWKSEPAYNGYEINKRYIEEFYFRCPKIKKKIKIRHSDFFSLDFNSLFKKSKTPLAIGNPPWVTNSQLGVLNSKNLPKKSNIKKLSGIESLTGKSNFDISEWIIMKLTELLQTRKGVLAMLCKTSVARSVFLHNNKNGLKNVGYKILKINSKKEFNISVDACLFICDYFNGGDQSICEVYDDLSFKKPQSRIGIDKKTIIANIDLHQKTKKMVKGKSNMVWRSGIKHDASKVMELLLLDDGRLVNGLEETVEIEDRYLYPLLKSSDLANNRLSPQRFVIMTQKKVGEDTGCIERDAPKLWNYLKSHCAILDGRKSSIYKKQPRFSMFGVGDYSYRPYKIAISGLYKKMNFCLLKTYKSRPVMVDDTCYLLGFDSLRKAEEYLKILQSRLGCRLYFIPCFFGCKKTYQLRHFKFYRYKEGFLIYGIIIKIRHMNDITAINVSDYLTNRGIEEENPLTMVQALKVYLCGPRISSCFGRNTFL